VITGDFGLDWALMSASLFNTILLLWLSLIVLLNTERRTWGLWLLDGGLMLGALFFISHTVMLGHNMTTTVSRELDFWWRIGWFPVVLAPYIWHVTLLWYAGFWDSPASPLRRRHLPGLIVTSALALGLLLFILLAHALPTYTQIAYRDTTAVPKLGGVPLLFMLYPPFAFLATTLPIDALLRPEPSARMMGDLARRRARPWLLGASLVLLLVGVLITGFFMWALNGYRVFGGIYFGWEHEIASFDLIMSVLIGGVLLLLGQAIVSYEIFTGKTLPRRGLSRHWRSIVLLAGGYAVLASWTVIYQPRPIYSTLLATLLMVVFYALFGWRSFVERDQFMERLRPFVTSQRLVNGFLSADDSPDSGARTLFRVVCADMLGAAHVHLIPTGALAPLIGQPLVYPDEAEPEPIAIPPELFEDAHAVVLPLDPAQHAGLEWAIPLWTERGPVGALLLGPKQDGGLYTQEEIEIARASAERIIDTLAGEQIARRLKEIQRRKLTETKVMDLSTRRTLHDDILPELHLIALRLHPHARTDPAVAEAIQSLTDVHHRISDLIHTLAGTQGQAGSNGSIVYVLRSLIDTEFKDAFDSVSWHVEPSPVELDPLYQEVVLNAVREVVRNAAVHGRGGEPDRALHLAVEIRCDETLTITVRDDGVGLAHRPQASVEPSGGSGGGLVLHGTLLAIAGGELRIDPQDGSGTRITISLPS
jgi:signal transduction histidine kinase